MELVLLNFLHAVHPDKQFLFLTGQDAADD